jgi:hypothetical protein
MDEEEENFLKGTGTTYHQLLPCPKLGDNALQMNSMLRETSFSQFPKLRGKGVLVNVSSTSAASEDALPEPETCLPAMFAVLDAFSEFLAQSL